MRTNNKRVLESLDISKEQEKALESIKADLLFLLTFETKLQMSESEKETEEIKNKIENRIENLAQHSINFYAISTNSKFQLSSMSTLREKILAFIDKGNYLEDYIFNLLKDRLEIKHKLIRKVTRPLKQEVVYEINFSKIQKLALSE